MQRKAILIVLALARLPQICIGQNITNTTTTLGINQNITNTTTTLGISESSSNSTTLAPEQSTSNTTLESGTNSPNATRTSGALLISNSLRPSLSILNSTRGTAGVFEPLSNLTSLFNGTSGSALVYNSWNNSGVYIPPKTSNGTWNATRQEWPSYYQNLSLSHLSNLGRQNGTTFNPWNVSQQILGEFSGGLGSLSPYFQNSGFDPLSSIVNVSNQISSLYSGPLSGFFTMLDGTIIPIYDLFWMTEMMEGLSRFFNSVRGGSGALLERGFRLDPVPVFRARNGLDALTYLLQSLQSSYNLNEVLDQAFNNYQHLVSLLSQLGGSACQGVNGRLRAMFEQMILGYPICNYELQSFENPNEWLESVEGLYNISQNFGSQFEGFRNFVSDLRRSNGFGQGFFP